MAKTIQKPKLLLVEGTHEEKFFNKLLDVMNLHDIQVLPILGKVRFREQIEILPKLDNFQMVEAIGVIRDADSSFDNALASLQDSLRNAGLSVPDRASVHTGQHPRVGIFIAPDNHNPGSLENLCLASIEGDPILGCVEGYLKCLQDIQKIEHPHKAKAAVQVYLSKEPDGSTHMGVASERNIWNWNSPALLSIKNFLSAL